MQMLNEMAVYAEVVERGGFSAAARHLQLTTSAVSRHVSRLETHLGGRLLQRTTRSVAVTELGSEVYAACVRMLGEAREIHALAGTYSARPNGVIRVSAPVVFGQVSIAHLLPEFLARYPEVDIRLSLTDRPIDLIEEGVDLAIRISSDLAPGLAARALCDMSYRLVANPNYLAHHAKIKTPTDLCHHPCIYLGYGEFGQTWRMQFKEKIEIVKVNSRLTINNSSAILAAVEQGAGIGLVPDFTAAAALQAGRVVSVLKSWKMIQPYAGKIHAVYVPGRHLALKTRALIDFLVEKFSH